MEDKKIELLNKYAVQAPRYTSYPSAPHFQSLQPQTYAQWLADAPVLSPISLYLHIPYCSKLCWFCGCHTQITQKYAPILDYLQSLESEIGLVSGKLGTGRRVSHVHFGGGSPTILQSQHFSRLMETLNQHFALGDETQIAIELDPRTTTEAKIASYRRGGVNRVSIGVQDFDMAVQSAINRIQPFASVYETVYQCREYGINDISVDLVYGLPKQTMESFSRSLERALLLTPNRIALFGYAHVPWKKKNMRLINEADLPDERQRFGMFSYACEYLRQAGYRHIGLDHFAKMGDAMSQALENHTLKRNFQGYTTDQSGMLIGFGASAISSLPQGYAQNTANPEDYSARISRGELAVLRGYALTQEDRLRRDIIKQLMCYYEVDIESVSNRHSLPVSIFDAAFASLEPMAADGLVERHGYRLKVNKALPQAVRIVCAVFDSYFHPQPNQHAQVA